MEPTDPTPALRGARLLVVDDNVDFTVLVQRYMAMAGAEVTTLHDGRAALAAALAAPFDVLLLDLEMPGMDGAELTKQLRTAGYAKPILCISAHAMKTHADSMLAAGCDAFYPKPISMRDLVAAIAKLIH